MKENNKIKVAMICHFSNAEVREHLPLCKRRVYRLARRLLRLPEKGRGYADIAPWDINIIQCVKERNDIDLYVLSAHGGLKRDGVSFESGGIHYTFYRPEIANLLRSFIPSPKEWRKFNPMAKKICRKVKEIHPDIVLLVGAENAYYSSAVLAIKSYPIYVLCQNIINNPEYVAAGAQDKINASTELEIIRQSNYMGVYCKKHYDLLRDAGYQKFVFDFNWPTPKQQQYKPKPSDKKDYDFVNFALHMSEEKGYHDSVKALAIVKKQYPNVKLCLIDGGPDTIRKEIKHLIAELDLQDNVIFIPFFAERKDVFQFLQSVRFAVLPCKIDNISGTQLQCMQFGLPVVCYKTTGTPSLNKERECVLIAEKDNISELAEKMLVLMNDEEKANSLRNNSLDYIKERRLRSLGNMQRLVDNFNAILANYRQGIPIPEKQLFENSSQE